MAKKRAKKTHKPKRRSPVYWIGYSGGLPHIYETEFGNVVELYGTQEDALRFYEEARRVRFPVIP